MLFSGFRLMRLLGFDVRVAPCCVAAAAILTGALGAVVLPPRLAGHDAAWAWLVAVVGGLGVYASLILHELGHALAARACRREVGGIQLWLLGGYTEVEDRQGPPSVELTMALAGPAVSLILAAEGLLAAAVLPASPMATLAALLGWANVGIAALNLVPVLPLDGGRALRAALQRRGASHTEATRVVAAGGAALGALAMIAGTAVALLGAPVPGIAAALLGWSFRFAARGEAAEPVGEQAGEPTEA